MKHERSWNEDAITQDLLVELETALSGSSVITVKTGHDEYSGDVGLYVAVNNDRRKRTFMLQLVEVR